MDESILENRNVQPSGIGGWLLIRVLQLIVLIPISVVKLLAIRPMTVWTTSGLVLGLVSLITGVLILTQRPFALRVVGLELGLTATYLVCIAGWAGIHNFPNLLVVAEQSLIGVTMCLVWFLYFRESVRVRNTFGRNL